jgi:hypothetical protein
MYLHCSIKATTLGRYSYLFHQTEILFGMPVLLFHQTSITKQRSNIETPYFNKITVNIHISTKQEKRE